MRHENAAKRERHEPFEIDARAADVEHDARHRPQHQKDLDEEERRVERIVGGSRRRSRECVAIRMLREFLNP